MALKFSVRDLFSPAAKTLAEAGIQPGSVVLDYGCGPGGYAIAAAEMVGPKGKGLVSPRLQPVSWGGPP